MCYITVDKLLQAMQTYPDNSLWIASLLQNDFLQLAHWNFVMFPRVGKLGITFFEKH